MARPWHPGPMEDLNSVIQVIHRMRVAEEPAGYPLFAPPESWTISSGVITIGGTRLVTVDTENGEAIDNLDTISGTVQCDMVILQIADDSRHVRLREVGNLTGLGPFNEFILTSTLDKAFLINADGTNLHALSLRSNA